MRSGWFVQRIKFYSIQASINAPIRIYMILIGIVSEILLI